MEWVILGTLLPLGLAALCFGIIAHVAHKRRLERIEKGEASETDVLMEGLYKRDGWKEDEPVQEEEPLEDGQIREADYEEYPARVEEKRISGGNNPTAYQSSERLGYWITFVTDRLERFTLDVGRGAFACLDLGDEGTLITRNGFFYDFEMEGEDGDEQSDEAEEE